MAHQVTIRDLAEATGLGKSTVQRALADHPSVSRKARESVREAAGRMGYRRDVLYSLLATKRARRGKKEAARLAYVANPPPRDVAASLGVEHRFGLSRSASELGYRLDVFRTLSPVRDADLLRVLYHRGYLGVVIGPLRRELRPIVLKEAHLPRVVCARIEEMPFPMVSHDITGQTREAWRQMRARGYRRIGAAISSHDPPLPDDLDRLGAILSEQAMLPRGMRRVPPYLGWIHDYPAFLEWFHRHRPDGVLAFRIGQYYALRDTGYPVENHGWAFLHASSPRGLRNVFAGISQNQTALEAEAIRYLDQRIRHGPPSGEKKPVEIVIPGDWQEGSTLPSRGTIGPVLP